MGADRTAEALRVLGDEMRIEILLALEEAGVRAPDGGGLSVTELYERVDPADPADLDYHLERLTDRFVAPTDAGYVLTDAGRRLVRALHAGADAGGAPVESAAIDGACPRCGDRHLHAEYEDGRVAIRCGACESLLARAPFGPRGFADRSVTEIADAVDAAVRHRTATAVDGVCARCSGRMVGTVTDGVPAGLDHEALVRFACRSCGYWFDASLGLCLLAHPDAVAFLREHRDAGSVERRFWELELCVSDRHLTVDSRDPWRVRVAVPGDGERLVATYEGAALASLVVEDD